MMPVNSIDELRTGLARSLARATSGRKLQEVADLAKDLIYDRTKSGRGVTSEDSNNARSTTLKSLSKEYVDRRRRTGVPGRDGSPGRSNLTYSGQMLDSMDTRIFSRRGFEVFIPDTTRRRTRSNGLIVDSGGQSNAKVAEYVSDNGRPFLNLTVDDVKEIEEDLEVILSTELARIVSD